MAGGWIQTLLLCSSCSSHYARALLQSNTLITHHFYNEGICGHMHALHSEDCKMIHTAAAYEILCRQSHSRSCTVPCPAKNQGDDSCQMHACMVHRLDGWVAGWLGGREARAIQQYP